MNPHEGKIETICADAERLIQEVVHKLQDTKNALGKQSGAQNQPQNIDPRLEAEAKRLYEEDMRAVEHEVAAARASTGGQRRKTITRRTLV